MDSKGALSVQPVRQSRVIALLAGVWLAIILALGIWWASIVLRQARRIAELSLASGHSAAEALAEVQTTQRMLYWESGSFLLLLLTLSGTLFWFYWRDMLRARGTQAFFAALTHELSDAAHQRAPADGSHRRWRAQPRAGRAPAR